MPKRVEKIKLGDRLISKENYERHQRYNPTTGCTEWTGVTSNIGYGFIGYTTESDKKGRMMTVHRIALALKLGRPIAPGMNANHSCHNMLCVTPEHLSEGTQQQKRADMVRDNIHNNATGPRGSYNKKQNRQYKYTEDEIQWIRNATSEEIAEKYNMDKRKAASTRYLFRNGYTWLPMEKK